MDRRRRKTRAAIKSACLTLLSKKSFEEISILDIANEADINRGTFYLHYEDKFDMIEKFEEELIQKINVIFIDNLKDAHSTIEMLQSRYPTLVQLLTCLQEEKE